MHGRWPNLDLSEPGYCRRDRAIVGRETHLFETQALTFETIEYLYFKIDISF